MPKIHTVQPGDTLSEIAENYPGISYQDLADANTDIIDNPDEIYPGQQLKVVSSDTAETPSTEEPSSMRADWNGDGNTDNIFIDYNNDGIVDAMNEYDNDGSLESQHADLNNDGSLDAVDFG